MKNTLVIENIIKKNNKIYYNYEINGKWEKLLKKDEKMFIEYDANIESVPDSVAIIPLLCNILPICWVFDIDIEVNELDEKFYNNIEKIKKGYIDMYPTMKFGGHINCKKIIKNDYDAKGAGVLFSGGVDAFNTLVMHLDEKPSLITVWGSDIQLSDTEGWNIVNKHHQETANDFNLKYHTIKTNFRDFIQYSALSNYVSKFIKGEWWHEFQHGIGLIGLSSPLAYVEKYEIVYIASSFTEEDKGKITCASDPTIDNNLKYASCKTIHDGYEFNRQDKIHNICNYVSKTNKSIKLRVCWVSTGGKNCCSCEKCYRTILGIIAEKNDPNKFGFNFNDHVCKKMRKIVTPHIRYNSHNYYFKIQKTFINNYKKEEIPQDLLWFAKIKILDKKPFYVVIKDNFLINLKKLLPKKIKNVIRKIYGR